MNRRKYFNIEEITHLLGLDVPTCRALFDKYGSLLVEEMGVPKVRS